MGAVLADPHAIIWYVTADARLSRAATTAMDAATADGDPIYISAISLVEVLYLVEKGRVRMDHRRILIEAVDDEQSPFRIAPLDRSVANALDHVSRQDVPDIPDRIIAATALSLRVPLLSRDRKIRASRVQTIW